MGLMKIMNNTPRYTINMVSVEYKGTGTETFAPPLPWSEVEKMCSDNNSQALIVLEAFDSDSRIVQDKKNVTVAYPCWDTNVNGIKDASEDVNKDKKWDSKDCIAAEKSTEDIKIQMLEHYANAQIDVKVGWRIYYPKEKIIVDDFRDGNGLGFSGKGPNPQAAVAALPNKRECVRQVGFDAGTKYGYRIAPQWIFVSRAFYKKGSDIMKTAGKKVRRTDDWNGAVELWKKEMSKSNKKTEWKAAYNIAVACEKEDNLEAALEWAKKSYKLKSKSVVASYIRTLQARIKQQEKVDEQMKREK